MKTRVPMIPPELAAAVDNGLGIGSCQEDGPCNILLTVRLNNDLDFQQWTRAIYADKPPTPEAPPSYPCLAVWFTAANRGSYKTMHYLYVLEGFRTYEDED